jgi:hypothetical protein
VRLNKSLIASRPLKNSSRLRHSESSVLARETFSGSYVFHASSAALTLCLAVSSLNGGTGGLTGAAKAAGVGKPTLWRWMQKPAFREASDMHAGRRSSRPGHASTVSPEAVEALRDVMNDQGAPHASLVSAARTVLDMAMQATNEEEIEKRQAALEARAMRRGAWRWGA